MKAQYTFFASIDNVSGLFALETFRIVNL